MKKVWIKDFLLQYSGTILIITMLIIATAFIYHPWIWKSKAEDICKQCEYGDLKDYRHYYISGYYNIKAICQEGKVGFESYNVFVEDEFGDEDKSEHRENIDCHPDRRWYW